VIRDPSLIFVLLLGLAMLVDWVTKLIEGKPVDDVHCQECRG
jgi:hypothetical protein